MFRRNFLKLTGASAGLAFLPDVDWVVSAAPNVLSEPSQFPDAKYLKSLTNKVRKLVDKDNPDCLRRLLKVDLLPQSAMPRYEKPNHEQYTVYARDKFGHFDVRHWNPKNHEAFVPVSQIACNSTVTHNVNEAATLIANKLIAQENAIIAKLLQQSFAWNVHPRREYGSSRFFNAGFQQIEQLDLVVYHILHNPDDRDLFRRTCRFDDGRLAIDFDREKKKYYLWTAELVPCHHVKPGLVVVLASPDTLGVVAVRCCPVVDYDETNKKLVAWMDNGYSVINKYSGVVTYRLGATRT